MDFSVNRNKQKLSPAYNKKNTNVVVIEKSNTFMHEILKATIGKILKDKHHAYVTESRFTSNLRADVYDLKDDIVYEIIHTESEESIELKRSKYPVREIVCLYTKDFENVMLRDLERKVKEKITKYL